MSVMSDSSQRENVKDVELADLAETRSSFYKLFSVLYLRLPDKRFMVSLHRLLSEPGITDYQNIPEKMVKSFKAIRKLSQSRKDDDKELIVEYTRLLRGYRPNKLPPPPYESVYRGQGQVFGSITSEVYEEYRNSGVEVADNYKGEPPDHIGIELDFMSHLCQLEAQAWKTNDYEKSLSLLNTERKFLEEHIMMWVYNLCDHLKRHSETGFYRSIAEATESWVAFDNEQINNISRSYP